MPYKIIKGNQGYIVKNTETGRVHAKHSTKSNAEAQVRLLYAIERGMVPRKK